MSEPEDSLARWSEQREALMEAAGALWGFYAALTDQGFEPSQALHLTTQWFISQLTGVGSDG